MRIKILAVLLVFSVLCLLTACQGEPVKTVEIPAVTGAFELTVIKSGQADTIFMQTKNSNIVLDCGEKDDGDELVDLLREKGVTNIDYLFITHFDKDHVGGFPEVMDNFTASCIIVPNYRGNNDEYEMYLDTVKNKNLTITTLAEDTTWVLDDLLIEVSIPKKNYYTEGDNDFSLAISLTHGENTFLFPGDAESERLPEIMSEFGRKYDFLKVPHHGKYNKVTQYFINVVKPRYAVVTDSDKHPASYKTMSILEMTGAEVYSARNGDVYVVSDGKEIIVNQKN